MCDDVGSLAIRYNSNEEKIRDVRRELHEAGLRISELGRLLTAKDFHYCEVQGNVIRIKYQDRPISTTILEEIAGNLHRLGNALRSKAEMDEEFRNRGLHNLIQKLQS